MDRPREILHLVEFDASAHYLVEPEQRLRALSNHLFDVIKTYAPAVIVKAGLGNGDFVKEIARNTTACVVVVDQSLELLLAFQAGLDEELRERIRLVAGDFYLFPVDYYAADLLISVDMLSFIDSARAVDEFRRALQFDGILFLASVVLADDDIEGRYDDYMRAVLPIHNDYYIQEDLKTFMGLNELNYIKGSSMSFPRDPGEMSRYFAEFRAPGDPDPGDFLEECREDFERLYGLRDGVISEPYFIGVFMRVKPPEAQKR